MRSRMRTVGRSRAGLRIGRGRRSFLGGRNAIDRRFLARWGVRLSQRRVDPLLGREADMIERRFRPMAFLDEPHGDGGLGAAVAVDLRYLARTFHSPTAGGAFPDPPHVEVESESGAFHGGIGGRGLGVNGVAGREVAGSSLWRLPRRRTSLDAPQFRGITDGSVLDDRLARIILARTFPRLPPATAAPSRRQRSGPCPRIPPG